VRLRLLALLLLSVSAAVLARDDVVTPMEHRRGEEQTFLTFPEWYLVHSPAELARYLAQGRAPSEFAWTGHIAQFWQGYRAVTRETATYPFNAGYHLMVAVIGTSTTVEYALKSAYESTAGRIAEASTLGSQTDEDRLAARVAQRYVDFIRVDPWYLFDFGGALRELWALPPTGDHMLRKWERRFALTSEYLVKAGYAWLIRQATGAIYEEARPVTAVALDRTPQPLPRALNGLRRLDVAGVVVVTVPRYQAFTHYAQALADQGVNFLEIAGNRGQIVVSVIAPSVPVSAAAPVRTILVQPIATQSGWERQVLALPVAELASQLRRWRAASVQVEHIYDY
jgi:hypothetical protein